MVYLNLDTVLPAPRLVHHALAGVALDMMCRGGDIRNGMSEILISGAAGAAGAVVVPGMIRAIGM